MPKLWPTGRAERQALTTVLAVAVVALAVLLVFVVAPGPKSGSVPYELMRVCVQVLGVSVVGFVVGMATFSLQQAHLERQRQDDRARLERQRLDDRTHLERQRLDDRIRSFLFQTVDSYNAVKQVRRMLRAETAPKAAPRITAEAYSRLLPELCKQQLVFEALKRSAPLIQAHVNYGDPIPAQGSGARRETEVVPLRKHYRHIESYLNEVVKEYETFRHLMPAVGHVSLAALGLKRTERFIYDTEDFKAMASHRIESVIEALEGTLLSAPRSGSEKPDPSAE
ncbi:hypothetical protein AB0H69_04830 [Streptomyces phaeochromogenes]|uniref:hypothetical protein n=1 Tax=Streptomyces phaeochromogenes TaxID=1923 RepID=UPI0033F0A2FF